MSGRHECNCGAAIGHPEEFGPDDPPPDYGVVVVCKACAGRVAALWGVDSSLSDEYRKVVLELGSNRTELTVAKAAAHNLEVEVAKLTRERDVAKGYHATLLGDLERLRTKLDAAQGAVTELRATQRREWDDTSRARKGQDEAERALVAARIQLEAREKERDYARETSSTSLKELTEMRQKLAESVPASDVQIVIDARNERIWALEAELRWAAAEVANYEKKEK